MGQTREERRAELMAMMEGEVDALLAWEATRGQVTMTEIEDQVLSARRRISERLAEVLIEHQVAKTDLTVPHNGQTGKALHYKGKKTKSAKPELGR
jgi:hypothetical protein